MERTDKLNIILIVLFDGDKTKAVKALDVSIPTINLALRTTGLLNNEAHSIMSDKGINIQCLYDDRYATSMFNTSMNGVLLSARFPQYAKTARPQLDQSPMVKRINEWINKYIGSREQFFDSCKFNDRDRGLWSFKLNGELSIDATEDSPFLDGIGINMQWALEGEPYDVFSKSEFGEYMRFQREQGDKVIFPLSMNPIDAFKLFAEVSARKQLIQEAKEAAMVGSRRKVLSKK